jgi:hypothetical protein
MNDDQQLHVLAQLLKASTVDVIAESLRVGREAAYDQGYIAGLEGAKFVLQQSHTVEFALEAIILTIASGPPPRSTK